MVTGKLNTFLPLTVSHGINIHTITEYYLVIQSYMMQTVMVKYTVNKLVYE